MLSNFKLRCTNVERVSNRDFLRTQTDHTLKRVFKHFCQCLSTSTSDDQPQLQQPAPALRYTLSLPIYIAFFQTTGAFWCSTNWESSFGELSRGVEELGQFAESLWWVWRMRWNVGCVIRYVFLCGGSACDYSAARSEGLEESFVGNGGVIHCGWNRPKQSTNYTYSFSRKRTLRTLWS